MRAISPISKYSIQLIEAVPKRGMDSSGTVIEYTDKKPVIAEFHQGGLTEWEQLVALEYFDFSGLPEGVNPLSRVAFFDTEAYVQRYPEDEQEAMLILIDKRLEQLSKLYPNEFRIVEKPAAPRPWPTFDETELDDSQFEDDSGVFHVVPGILTLQALSGWSAEAIRLYEVENKNRPEVVPTAAPPITTTNAEVVQAMEALEAEAQGAVRDEAISVAL